MDQTVEYENYTTETIRPIKKTGNASRLPGQLVGTEYKSGLTSYSELTGSNALIFLISPPPFSLNCHFLSPQNLMETLGWLKVLSFLKTLHRQIPSCLFFLTQILE